MRLLRACLLFAAAGAFTSPVPSAVRRQTILRAEEANVGTAVRNIAPWLLFVLVGLAPRPRLSPSRVDGVLAARRRLTGRPHTEPALRIPNYKECVADKGHEACANLLPFFQWLYEHGVDVAAI